MTVTRFTPPAMKHDRLASSLGRSPWQKVPWLQWSRLHIPRLCVTVETLDTFRDTDQVEFVNIGTNWILVNASFCTSRTRRHVARQKPERQGL